MAGRWKSFVAALGIAGCAGGCGASMSTDFSLVDGAKRINYAHRSGNSQDSRKFSWKQTAVKAPDGTVTTTTEASAGADVNPDVEAIRAQNTGMAQNQQQFFAGVTNLLSMAPFLKGGGQAAPAVQADAGHSQPPVQTAVVGPTSPDTPYPPGTGTFGLTADGWPNFSGNPNDPLGIATKGKSEPLSVDQRAWIAKHGNVDPRTKP